MSLRDLELLDEICLNLRGDLVKDLSSYARNLLFERLDSIKVTRGSLGDILKRIREPYSEAVKTFKCLEGQSLSHFTRGDMKIFVLGIDPTIRTSGSYLCRPDETFDWGWLMQFLAEDTIFPYDIFIDPTIEDKELSRRLVDMKGFTRNEGYHMMDPLRIHSTEPFRKKPSPEKIQKQLQMIPESERSPFERFVEDASIAEDPADLYTILRMFRTFRKVKGKLSFRPRAILYVGKVIRAERIREFLRRLGFHEEKAKRIDLGYLSVENMPFFPAKE